MRDLRQAAIPQLLLTQQPRLLPGLLRRFLIDLEFRHEACCRRRFVRGARRLAGFGLGLRLGGGGFEAFAAVGIADGVGAHDAPRVEIIVVEDAAVGEGGDGEEFEDLASWVVGVVVLIAHG